MSNLNFYKKLELNNLHCDFLLCYFECSFREPLFLKCPMCMNMQWNEVLSGIFTVSQTNCLR